MKRVFALLIVSVVALVAWSFSIAESPFCAGALHAQAQGQEMPPPGNPDHKEPPKGAFCDHSKRPAHACACHAKCVLDEKGNIVRIEEDPKCRAWCFKKHCRCPADCE